MGVLWMKCGYIGKFIDMDLSNPDLPQESGNIESSVAVLSTYARLTEAA
jgi:hypothetical protein